MIPETVAPQVTMTLPDSPRILVVEDDEVDFIATRRMLSKIFGSGLILDWAKSRDEAIERINARAHDVYLVDYNLGGLTGLDLLRETTVDADPPAFIFLTGMEDHALDLAATEAGAADFLVKSDVTASRLERSIRYAISMKLTQQTLRLQAEELRQAHGLVQEQAERYMKKAQELANAQRETRVALRRAEASEERYKVLAERDVLTDLANRAVLTRKLDAAIAHARRANSVLGLLFLDLDRFKNVNDTLGHAVGDKLLIAVARRLLAAVRETDLVARLGGDEFAIILTGMRESAHTATVAVKIIESITAPFDIDGTEVQIGTSIGIAQLESLEDDSGSMLKKADLALYKAKSEGRGTHRFFDRKLNEQVKKWQRLEVDLAAALAAREFSLEFQPQISQETGKVSAVDTQFRWEHPEFGRIAPAEFIQIAEASNFIIDLSQWALGQALAAARLWSDRLERPVPVVVSLSPQELARQGLAPSIVEALEDAGLDPSLLQLELTEASIRNPSDTTVAQLNQLHSQGVQIVLEDFSMGNASLSRARDVPIDKIKIDRALVADILENRRGAAIVRALITLAEHLDVKAIVDGVETQAQRDYFGDAKGIDLQGGAICGPLASDVMLEWLCGDERSAFESAGAQTDGNDPAGGLKLVAHRR